MPGDSRTSPNFILPVSETLVSSPFFCLGEFAKVSFPRAFGRTGYAFFPSIFPAFQLGSVHPSLHKRKMRPVASFVSRELCLDLLPPDGGMLISPLRMPEVSQSLPLRLDLSLSFRQPCALGYFPSGSSSPSTLSTPRRGAWDSVPGQGDSCIDLTMTPVPCLLARSAHRGLGPLAFFPDATTPLCSSVTLLSFPRSGQPNTAIWGRVTFPVYVSKYLSGCEIDQTCIKINLYGVTDYSPPGGTSDSLLIWGPETWLGPWGPLPTHGSPGYPASLPWAWLLSWKVFSPGDHGYGNPLEIGLKLASYLWAPVS